MSSTTRISDLPENITLQTPNPGGVFPPAVETRAPEKMNNEMMNSQTTYVPLNIHSNPYGHPPQPPNGQMPPFPEPGQQQQKLPSRDIPMNQLEFQQDAEVQPNYIPRPKMPTDYIREYEQDSARDRRQVDRRKVALQTADDWYERLQIPILVALLFFIFQMPVFNTFLRKNFTFMSLHNEDGNFNIIGLVFKSLLFGGIFYSMQQFLVSFGN
jgi:hypothetical protein